MHHVDMKEEKISLEEYFIFVVSLGEYTPSMFLKCRGMGWDLVVADGPEN